MSDVRLRFVDNGEYGKYGLGTLETVCMEVGRDKVDKDDSDRDNEVMEDKSNTYDEEDDVDDNDHDGDDDTAFDEREDGNGILVGYDNVVGGAIVYWFQAKSNRSMTREISLKTTIGNYKTKWNVRTKKEGVNCFPNMIHSSALLSLT